MDHFEQRAGTSALPEIRFAHLGERIVEAARMAVIEHLRQEAIQCSLPIVMGGADHGNGNDSFKRLAYFSGNRIAAEWEAA